MTLVGELMSASCYHIMSFIFSIIAMVMNWISFLVPTWGFTGDTNIETTTGYGVWRICNLREFTPNCKDISSWGAEWFQIFQGCATLGFLGVNLSFILILLLVFVDKCKTPDASKEIAFWNFIQCLLTGCCYVAAIILFGHNFDEDFRVDAADKETLGYSFYLAIVAVALNIIGVAIPNLIFFLRS